MIYKVHLPFLAGFDSSIVFSAALVSREVSAALKCAGVPQEPRNFDYLDTT